VTVEEHLVERFQREGIPGSKIAEKLRHQEALHGKDDEESNCWKVSPYSHL